MDIFALDNRGEVVLDDHGELEILRQHLFTDTFNIAPPVDRMHDECTQFIQIFHEQLRFGAGIMILEDDLGLGADARIHQH